MHENRPYTFDRVVRLVLSLAIITGFYFLLRRLSDALIPFFLAVLIAYLINPLVDFLQFKLRFKYRPLAVFGSLICVLGGMYLIGSWLIPQFIDEMTKMIRLIKEYLAANSSVSSFLPDQSIEKLNEMISNTDIQNVISSSSVADFAKNIIGHVWDVFSGSVSFLLGVVSFLIVLVYVVFLLIDFQRIAKGWKTLVPKKYRHQVTEVFQDLKNGMHIYFRAQGLIALIVGVLLSIGFKIIGLPMAIIVGLFIGLLNIVPYLQIIGIIPVALLSLLKAMETQQSFWNVILLAFIVLAVVQVIQEMILIPRIMGRVYGLHPAIILLSLSIWGSLLGILGMLVALPLTTLLISYYNRFVLKHE